LFLEVIESLITPCTDRARRLGFHAESVALGARRRRLRRAWSPHVATARSFVERLPSGGRIVVLGSGRLIEIPLASLLERFNEVTLIDIVHPWPVRIIAAFDKRIRLIEADVTGVVGPLSRGEMVLPNPPEIGEFDLALSANLLSQLPLLLLDHVPEDERDRFARALVASHWNWVRSLAPVAALFSDAESIWRDPRTGAEQRDSTLWGVEPPPSDETWTWNLAPAPEEDRKLDHLLTVHAWFDLNKTAPFPFETETTPVRSNPDQSL